MAKLPFNRDLVWIVSSYAYEKTAPGREAFEHAIRSDDRVKVLSAFWIAIFVKLAFILFYHWLSRGDNRPTWLGQEGYPEKVFPKDFDETIEADYLPLSETDPE